MIQWLIHHADVVSLRGDSHRLKDLGRVTSTANDDLYDQSGVKFTCRQGSISLAVDKNADYVYSSLCDVAGYPAGWNWSA
jgi:hypothetical protein